MITGNVNRTISIDFDRDYTTWHNALSRRFVFNYTKVHVAVSGLCPRGSKKRLVITAFGLVLIKRTIKLTIRIQNQRSVAEKKIGLYRDLMHRRILIKLHVNL